MTLTRAHIDAAADALQAVTAVRPRLGLILGSGLNSLADGIEAAHVVPQETIPGWPRSTVPGHAGRVVLGRLAGETVFALQGRTHYYEGYDITWVPFGVRVMQRLGVDTLIVTNAAGGINADFRPGDIMVIRDHINLPGLAGANPLRGENDPELGPRFPDMIDVYDPDLRRLAHRAAGNLNLRLQEGVYAFVGGPSYETPAELRLLRAAGADAVGMSTVPEVVVARHAGMRVLGLSSITNMAVPDPVPGTHIDHEEVLAAGRDVVPRLTALLQAIIADQAHAS